MTKHETGFAAATRIAAGDDGTTYDIVSIWLHWATALLVVVQFALGQTWDWFARPTRQVMESTHISLGMLLAAVIIARLIWRLMPGHEVTVITSGWIRTASRSVHLLLYALLVGEIVLGFAWRWAQGHPVDFFGLFAIPGPYGQLDKPARGLLHELHEWGAWTIIALAGVHALGALYHHYVLKDRVLERMLSARLAPAGLFRRDGPRAGRGGRTVEPEATLHEDEEQRHEEDR